MQMAGVSPARPGAAAERTHRLRLGVVPTWYLRGVQAEETVPFNYVQNDHASGGPWRPEVLLPVATVLCSSWFRYSIGLAESRQ